MSRVDVLAAQMVMRARQFERALHDPGPWKVRVAGQTYSARKVVGEDHVTFFALALMEEPRLAELLCDGDTVSVRQLDNDLGWAHIAWEFVVEEPVAA
jgi:hypothetical protein